PGSFHHRLIFPPPLSLSLSLSLFLSFSLPPSLPLSLSVCVCKRANWRWRSRCLRLHSGLTLASTPPLLPPPLLFWASSDIRGRPRRPSVRSPRAVTHSCRETPPGPLIP